MTAVGSISAGGFARLAGRIVVVVLVAATLYGLERKGLQVAERRMSSDPKIVREFEAAPQYNAFIKAAQPVFNELDRIQDVIVAVIQALDAPEKPTDLDATVRKLSADSEALSKRIAALPAGNAEIVEMRDRLSSAADRQNHVVSAFRKFLETGDPSALSGPAGFQAQIQAYRREFQELDALFRAYFKKYGLVNKGP
jgi:hypothetical protein